MVAFARHSSLELREEAQMRAVQFHRGEKLKGPDVVLANVAVAHKGFSKGIKDLLEGRPDHTVRAHPAEDDHSNTFIQPVIKESEQELHIGGLGI